MPNLKSAAKAIILMISGIAIVVVGGFMMGAVARLWSRDTKNTKDAKEK